MPAIKEKFRSRVIKQRLGSSRQKINGMGLNDEQLIKLLKAYRTMGEILERLGGRERLYRPRFLRGLESALHDVTMGRTQEVKTFEDFATKIFTV
jgi:hypothetical protein